MDTTRNSDLELLELARDKDDREPMKARKDAILESVWLQAKDPTLSKIRDELTKWLNYGFEHIPDEGMDPTPKQTQAMAEAEMNIQRLEKIAQDYVRTPGFQQQMLERMSRHDPQRAESIAVKNKKKEIA